MGDTFRTRLVNDLGEAWRVSLAMAMYREPEAASALRTRLGLGLLVGTLQLPVLALADCIRQAHLDWFPSSFWRDALVFWIALIVSVGIVAGILFLRDFSRILQALQSSMSWESLKSEGEQILREMRRAPEEDDDFLWLDALERGKRWQRVDLPAALSASEKLRQAFNRSRYRSPPYVSGWSGPRLWVPAMDQDIG